MSQGTRRVSLCDRRVDGDQRAELDCEVNVRAYRKLGEIQAALARVTERLDALETKERDC